MPHWAEIDENNKVLRVTYGEGTDEESYQWLIDNLGGIWVRTYYDTPEHTYAGIGYTWNPSANNFVAPASETPTPPATLSDPPIVPPTEPTTLENVQDPSTPSGNSIVEPPDPIESGDTPAATP